MDTNTLSAISFTVQRVRAPLTGDLSHRYGGRHQISYCEFRPWQKRMDCDITESRLITHCSRCGIFLQAPILITGIELLEQSDDAEKIISYIRLLIENGYHSTIHAYWNQVCGPTETYRRRLKRLSRMGARKP